MTMSLNVVMLASGAFGLFPKNPVTQLFQKVISEQIPYPFIKPLNGFLAQMDAPQIPVHPKAGEGRITQKHLLDPAGILIDYFTSLSNPGAPNDDSNVPPPETEDSLVATQVSIILTDAFVTQSTGPMSLASPSTTSTAASTGTSTGTATLTVTPSVSSTLNPLHTLTTTLTSTRTPRYTPTGTFTPARTSTFTSTPALTTTSVPGLTTTPMLTLTSLPTDYAVSPTATETPIDIPFFPPMLTDEAPFVVNTYPNNGETGVPTTVKVVVTFSEPVVAGDASIDCGSGARNMSASGSGTTEITFDPGGVPASSTCAVTVYAAQISDVDFDDPPDAMMEDYFFEFAVAP